MYVFGNKNYDLPYQLWKKTEVKSKWFNITYVTLL